MRVRPGRTWGVLGNRDFALLWLGMLVSSVGDWINYVAMVALVYQQTHSALALALLRLFHIVPILLVAPFAGVFVDRWNRKRTLVLSAAVAGLAAGTLALYHPVLLVFMVYGAITVAMAFFNPARSAAIPSIVSDDQLVPANSLAQITSTASIVVGGLVGGLLVTLLGVNAAFAFNGISFGVIALAISAIRLRDVRVVGAAAQSVSEDLREGLAHLRDHPLVATTVIAGGIFVFAPATVFTLGIVFVQTNLHAGSIVYGIILASMGVGSAIGAILTVALRGRLRQGLTFALSGVALGAGVLAMGVSHTALPAALGYGLAGFGGMANTVSAVTLIQRLVPDRIRGRIFAVSSTFDHLAAFASTLLVGAGSGLASAGDLIAVAGGVAMLTGLLSLRIVSRQTEA